MNAARALGNLGDREHVPLLTRVMGDHPDETVRDMCGWALGRLGGPQAKAALESRLDQEGALGRKEIKSALTKIR